MRLRARLTLTLAALVIPLAIGVALYAARSREQTVRDTLADAMWQRMNGDVRARCESSPERWPGRGSPRRRGGRWAGRRPLPRQAGPFPFAADLTSRHPRAPELSDEARRRALTALSRETTARVDDPRGDLIAVKMPWEDGPCAVLVVRRPVEPSGAFRRNLVPPLLVSLASVLIVMLVAGPIVRRIRRLTRQVEAGAGLDTTLTASGDEIGQLSRAFEARRKAIDDRMKQIEAQDEALRRFVANTAHDVMTPVTVLQGHLSAVDEATRAGQVVDASRVRDAMEEAHYLASLLRNLNVAAKLEASAIEGGALERHPVDLTGLVERIVARYRPYARQREVSLEHATPGEGFPVEGDVTLLEQAVGNLVQNAIRYNDVGGHVAIVLERPLGGGFSLTVLDDGPGVDDSDLARITERGFRGARARMRRPGGLGLGLSLVREVAERHDFDLRFERPAEGGLRVVLSG